MTDAPIPSSVTDPPVRNAIAEYFAHRFDRVDQARSSQPHWTTPLVTVTPRLEQEVRADVYLVQLGNGASVTSYGNGKGLELIPTTTNEVILNAPGYAERSTVRPASGFADWPFIPITQQLVSANEERGNSIVTALLGATAPVALSNSRTEPGSSLTNDSRWERLGHLRHRGYANR